MWLADGYWTAELMEFNATVLHVLRVYMKLLYLMNISGYGYILYGIIQLFRIINLGSTLLFCAQIDNIPN